MTQSAKIGGEFHTEAAVGRKWFGWVPLVGLLIFISFCPVLLAVASFTRTDVMKRDTILSGVTDGLAQKKMGGLSGMGGQGHRVFLWKKWFIATTAHGMVMVICISTLLSANERWLG